MSTEAPSAALDDEPVDLTVVAATDAPPARRARSGAGGRVLVYDQGGSLGPAVHDALAPWDQAPEVVECSRPRALGDLLTGARFDVLVAGPGLDTRAGLERLRIIREEVPAMGLVLVAGDVGRLDAAALVRTGALDLVDSAGDVVEQVTAALDRALRISGRLRSQLAAPSAAPEDAAPSPAARVITITSASGGCGKTFLATNLAWFLHHHGRRRTCLIDLDLQFGEVSSSLRLRPRYTISDLIQADDDDLVAQFEELCEVHESGVVVLASPQDPAEAELVGPGDVARVLTAARSIFDEVVVDTPPALTDTVVTAFRRSDELLVMATLDVPSIRNLQVLLSTFDRLDIDGDGLHLVLNKAEEESPVEAGRILKLFPRGFDASLPYAREVLRSLNAGRVVLDADPAAPISRELGTLLRRYLDPEALAAFDAQRPVPRSGRLRRLASRPRSGS